MPQRGPAAIGIVDALVSETPEIILICIIVNVIAAKQAVGVFGFVFRPQADARAAIRVVIQIENRFLELLRPAHAQEREEVPVGFQRRPKVAAVGDAYAAQRHFALLEIARRPRPVKQRKAVEVQRGMGHIVFAGAGAAQPFDVAGGRLDREIDTLSPDMVMRRVKLAGRNPRARRGILGTGELPRFISPNIQRQVAARDHDPHDGIENQGAIVLEVVVNSIRTHDALTLSQQHVAFEVDPVHAGEVHRPARLALIIIIVLIRNLPEEHGGIRPDFQITRIVNRALCKVQVRYGRQDRFAIDDVGGDTVRAERAQWSRRGRRRKLKHTDGAGRGFD